MAATSRVAEAGLEGLLARSAAHEKSALLPMAQLPPLVAIRLGGWIRVPDGGL